ncbi:MAG: hypothetical protein QW545_03000 [Thermosphaera sp.]
MLSRRFLVLAIALHLFLALASSLQASPAFEALPLAAGISQDINIDGDPSDWGDFTCPDLPVDNAYGVYYYSTVGGVPQWIWCDAGGDERTDFSSPDKRVDLLQFRVTGDSEFLYLLFILNDTSGFSIGDNGATFIALAINRNGSTGGTEFFAGNSETRVASDAAWDYQVVVNLADSRYSGQGKTALTEGLQSNWGGIFYLVDKDWSFITGERALMGVDLSRNSIEVRIPWGLIGGVPSGGVFFLRLSLITARGWSNYDGNGGGTWDIGGDNISDALDAMTTAGPNTWDEVGDGVVDYFADVYFTTTPPYYPVPEPGLLVAAGSLIPVTGFIGYELRRRRRSNN